MRNGWGAIKHGVIVGSVTLVAAVSLNQCELAPGCDATPCGNGQVTVCIDKCATPVAVGGTCSTDPCASNGFCADGATCYSFLNNGVGTCVQFGQTIAAPCGGTGHDPNS